MIRLPKYDIAFLNMAYAAAAQAKHPFPDYAACEGALESGYGHSALYHDGNNIFGTKQHSHPLFGTLSIPTKEFLGGHWLVVDAEWVKYPTLTDAFADRVATLTRLAPHYPHYAAALAAKTGEDFVRAVSMSWSTDPDRADKVLDISDAWLRNPVPAMPVVSAQVTDATATH